ncbi:ribose 5-phosphate isomerase B [Anaerofustis stercorihominis]|uniref:Ribose-5-phosphate isomerase B n=1 Tax=Anaerofustis stercorihominis DSM 17244 TaxID=445971 RepID=B1CAL4_9FIRM|nr:ribose 5-phosphate isomerase B [Anaerofustis stercorihominis]EDS72487.1 ribose-5-phosphate isomerase B [Anaerofustis stercorihominis DSM 17244]MCQ4795274.1 ribose 5-phosphate isomerase B [Anaerofustis stercorihominis]
MKIVIASDHGGYELKQFLIETFKKEGYDFVDYGTNSEESVDYPDYAIKTCEDVAAGKFDRGILICGTGIGISIAANKVKGIRAAHCTDCFSAKMCKQHNNANVIVLGGRITGPELAAEILRTYLNEKEFLGGRHENRVNKIKAYEEKVYK